MMKQSLLINLHQLLDHVPKLPVPDHLPTLFTLIHHNFAITIKVHIGLRINRATNLL